MALIEELIASSFLTLNCIEIKLIQSRSPTQFQILKAPSPAGQQNSACVFQEPTKLVRKAFSFSGLKGNDPLQVLMTDSTALVLKERCYRPFENIG